MSSKAIAGLKPVALATMVPGGTARRHSHRCRLRRSPNSSSTFLRPFAPDPLQALPRSYGRSDSCSPRRITVCSTAVCSVNEQVSLIHALGLPAIPSPTTSHCSASPGRGTLPHQRVGPRWHPTNGFLPRGTRGLHLSLAGSPQKTGRIEFSFLSCWRDFLRTSRSPPAALHPVSRRRSCSRLQVTLTWRGLAPLRPSALSGAQGRGFSPAVPTPST
jgi:hypothetical protein